MKSDSLVAKHAASILASALADAQHAHKPVPEAALSLARLHPEMPGAKALISLAHARVPPASPEANMKQRALTTVNEHPERALARGVPAHPLMRSLEQLARAPEGSVEAGRTRLDIGATLKTYTEQGMPREMNVHEKSDVFRAAAALRGTPEADAFNHKFGQHFRPSTMEAVGGMLQKAANAGKGLAEVGHAMTRELGPVGKIEEHVRGLSEDRLKGMGLDPKFVREHGFSEWLKFARGVRDHARSPGVHQDSRPGSGASRTQLQPKEHDAPGLSL